MWQGIALCLLASLASSSAQCSASYQVFDNMHVSGSTSVAAADRDACQALCDGNPVCVGYDWTTSGVCWPTLNPDTAITSDPTATHYRHIETCVDGAASCVYRYVGAYTSTALSTMTGVCGDACNTITACNGYVNDASAGTDCLHFASTAVRTASANHRMFSKHSCDLPSTVCAAPTYEDFVDMHVSGGTRAANGDASLASCQGLCSNDIACVGVDYTDGGQCYMITNPDTAITADPASTHYSGEIMCTTGNNVCGYDLYGSFVPNAGQTTTPSQTFDQCVTRCNDDSGCTQLAYDASTMTCVTSTGTAAQKTGNAAYEMLRKQTTCPVAVTPTPSGPSCGDPVWTITTSRSSNGATSRSAFTTLATCLAECVGDDTCVAVDFSSTAPNCWIHTSTADLSDERNTPGINQHVLVERCPGVCVPTWQMFPGMGSPNGMIQSSANTLAACQAACIASSTCISVDFTTTNQCYFHTNVADMRRDDGTSTQYVLNRDCSTDSTTVDTTTGTATGTPTGTTVPGCVPAWTETSGTSSTGGDLEAGATNLVDCQQACVDNAACVGLDWTGSACWLHTNENMFNSGRRDDTDVTQYTLVDRCPQACTNTWSDTLNTHGSGGTHQPGINSLADCQAGCIADANCVALDHNTNTGNFPCWFFFATGYAESAEQGTNHYKLTRCVDCVNTWQNTTSRSSGQGTLVPGSNGVTNCLLACVANEDCVAADINTAGVCYHHTDVANLDDERNTPDVTQYRLSRCSTSVCPIFQEFENKHALNGMPQNSATVELCKAVCIANVNCKGVDFDPGNSGTKCYTFSMEFSEDQLQDMTGTTHYELVCRAGQSPPPTGSTLPGGSTSPGCDNVFTLTEGRSSNGATRRSDFADLDTCLDRCVDEEDCVAVDANVSPFQCWFHLAASNLDTNKDTPGINQHVLARCVTAVCPEFREYEDVHALGGIPQPAIDSLAGCKAACDTSTDCKGLDYAENASGTKCWLVNTQSAPDNLEALTGVNHYDLICRTGETPSTGSGGTTRPGATTGGGCVDTFTSESNVHGFGGVQQTDVTTLDECKDACSDAEEDACVAFDFVTSSSACWLLPMGFQRDTNAAPGVTQYTITRCVPGCDDTFEELAGQHGIGGQEDTSVMGEDGCKAACSADASCLAFDLAGTRCWFFTSTYTREAASGVTHFVIDRCTMGPTTRGTTVRPTTATSQPCFDGFDTRTQREATTNEVAYTEIDRLSNCWQICQRYPLPCYGANFNLGARTCTLVLDADFTIINRGGSTLLQARPCA